MRLRAPFLAGLIVLCAGGRVAHADGLQKLRSRGAEVYYADLDLRAAFARAHPKVLPEEKRKLPAASAGAFDWSARVTMPHWLTQAQLQYCWAFAALTAFEWNWAIRNGSPAPALAVQPVLDRLQKEAGAPHALALEDLLRHGTCSPKLYPHVGRPGPLRTKVKMSYRAIAWGSVAPDAGMPTPAEMKQALLHHGPLVVGVHTTPLFKTYRGGIFREHFEVPRHRPKTNHSVVIVGWDDHKGPGGCWKVQNSWGPLWGLSGFMWIEYGCNNIGFNACWVRAQAVQYNLPRDIHEQISGGADPFPRWPGIKDLTVPPPDLPLITAAEASKLQGERAVVQLQVKAWGPAQPGNHIQLYTTPDWRDKDCVVIRLLREELHRFPSQDGQTLFNQYRGKRLRVRGSLQPMPFTLGEARLLRLVIEVADPAQIEVMD